ncbi:MAG: hypothetical protein OHK0028_00170 [Deltaproteobacteria bacterium]
MTFVGGFRSHATVTVPVVSSGTGAKTSYGPNASPVVDTVHAASAVPPAKAKRSARTAITLAGFFPITETPPSMDTGHSGRVSRSRVRRGKDAGGLPRNGRLRLP